MTEIRVWRCWLLVSRVTPGILSISHSRTSHCCSQSGLCRPVKRWPIRSKIGVISQSEASKVWTMRPLSTRTTFSISRVFLIWNKTWVWVCVVIPWTWCVLHSSHLHTRVHVKFTLSIAILSAINKMNRFPVTTQCITVFAGCGDSKKYKAWPGLSGEMDEAASVDWCCLKTLFISEISN